MPTTDERSLNVLLERARDLCESGMRSESPDECGAADQLIREADSFARERVQSLLRTDLERIAEKLEMGVALTLTEERTVETAVIGSAIGYIEIENNVAEWKAELTRLMEELRIAGSRTDVDGMLRVRGLCRDALNVLSDLLLYVREKERIQRFREGASSGDPERGRIIARFIRESLESEIR
jgi:hypothetical protein